MRPVAVVAAAISELTPGDPAVTAIERVFDVSHRAVSSSGLPRERIGLTVTASSDMLEGRPFNFVKGLEAVGAWPAIHARHVEMDGAWAAYEAWSALQSGEFDSALIVAWSTTSEASLHHVLNAQLDPFTLSPLGLDHVTTAALQADAFLTRVNGSPRTLDEAVVHARDAASRHAGLAAMGDWPIDAPVASPLRGIHCPRYADGACAIVLAAGEALEPLTTPMRAWIRGADHRTETGALGHRDLSRAVAARAAWERAGAIAGWTGVDVAEVGASFAHQVPMLVEALSLQPEPVNPSGGPLAADPICATGLIRLAEAAMQATGSAGTHQVPGVRRTLAHASSGHAMQQNMVWLLEGAA